MVTDTDTDAVTTDEAALIAGVSARTIRRWIQHGKLPATPTQDGYLIAVSALAGVRATAGQRSWSRGHAATVTDTSADIAADAVTDTDTPVTVNTNARAQLEAIRDEWLAPLVAQITTQAERIGHLEAERDELRKRTERAEAERDRLIVEQAAPAAPGVSEGANVDSSSPALSAGFWARVRRVFGDS